MFVFFFFFLLMRLHSQASATSVLSTSQQIERDLDELQAILNRLQIQVTPTATAAASTAPITTGDFLSRTHTRSQTNINAHVIYLLVTHPTHSVLADGHMTTRYNYQHSQAHDTLNAHVIFFFHPRNSFCVQATAIPCAALDSRLPSPPLPI